MDVIVLCIAIAAVTAAAAYRLWGPSASETNKLRKMICSLEKRRKLEVDYYTTTIHHLEITNNNVQREAQSLRISSARLRNLYDRNASFMSKADLEKAVIEVSQRLASMKSSLIKLKEEEPSSLHECNICANTFNLKISCKNSKCTYGWCKDCSDKLRKNGVKYCPAGCRGAIL